jgi:hypothetical protein
MALTKLTKHTVHGATIVQVRFKDVSDLTVSNTSENNWGSITLTPQYADSILEIHFTGMVDLPARSGDMPNHTYILDVNGTNEYTMAGSDGGSISYSFNSGTEIGDSVNMFHRHAPGTTNLQTITAQVSRNNNNGTNTVCRDGFFCVKEIAGGVTLGTPGNNYV